MSLKAIVELLGYRLKKDEEETLHKIFVAENLATMSAGMKTQERIGFMQTYKKIWDIKDKEDNRTADEIIEDTFKKHGLKIKRKTGGTE